MSCTRREQVKWDESIEHRRFTLPGTVQYFEECYCISSLIEVVDGAPKDYSCTDEVHAELADFVSYAIGDNVLIMYFFDVCYSSVL